MAKRKAKGMSKKTRKGMHEKMCNMCGELCYIYMVYKNAPLCQDCMPVKELKKVKNTIPNETRMIDSLLKFK